MPEMKFFLKNMKIQRYFSLIYIILSLFVIFFSCLCWALSSSQSKTASCNNTLSPLTTTARSVSVVRNDLLGGSVRGPQPKQPLDTVESDLSKGAIQFREAYNKGFFTQNERYISIVNYSKNQISIYTHSVYIKSYNGDRLVI